jgi:hypothetical protein
MCFSGVPPPDDRHTRCSPKSVTWRISPPAEEAPPRHGTRDGTIATHDRASIKRWAARHRAEPARADVTRSGSGTVDVHDGGSPIRFNVPGCGHFRPITWDEWFQDFERHGLTFVYEESSDDAHRPSPRYRIVKTEDGNAPVG